MKQSLRSPLASIMRQFQSDRFEYSKILFLFGYLFCVVSAATVGRTAADTLFLSQYDSSMLSYMYLPQAVTLLLVGIIYQRICGRFRTDQLVAVVILMAGLLALMSRIAIGMEVNGILPVIYIGYDVLNFLMIVSFWQFATATMDQRKAKRTIGWVGSGGILGGILSGFGLKLLVQPLGTENLIYVYAGFQLLSLLFVLLVNRKISNRSEVFNVKNTPKKPGRATEKQQGLFQAVPHLRYVAIVAGTIVISLTLIDYQFKIILRGSLQNEALAGFMGSFYGYAGILALLVQFFMSGKLITRFGVTTAILVFPFVLFTGSALLLIMPVVAIATMVKGSDKVLGDTVYSSVSQLIMFPIPPEWRGRAKGFLDGIVRNGAKGIAAISLLLLSQKLSIEQFSYIILGLITCGMVAAIKIKKAYLRMLLTTLQSKTMSMRDDNVNLMDPASIQVMVEALRGSDKQQAMYAFQLLQGLPEFDVKPYMGELLQHPSEEIQIAILQSIQLTVPLEAEPLLYSLMDSPIIRIRSNAILAIAAYAKESNMERIVDLLKENESQIRSVAIAGLIKYYGIEGMFHAVGALKEMLGSEREEERTAMANLFGVIGISSFYKPLIPMLGDSSDRVRIGALKSAKSLRIPELIPYIVPLLEESSTRQQAIEAMAAYEENGIIPLLKTYLYADQDHLHIPRVLETIGTAKAFDALLEGYSQLTVDMREKAVESAARMKSEGCSIDPGYGEQLVMMEIALYWEWVKHRLNLPDTDRLKLLIEAIEETIARQVRTLFELLALVYDAKTIHAVYANWSTGDVRQQANAAEVIDQLLTGKLRTEMTRIITQKTTLREGASEPTLAETSLDWLQGQADPWMRRLIDHVHSPGTELNDESLERVHLLKNVSLFSELPGRDLFHISKQLEPVHATIKTPIITEMDTGDSLYLIKQGTMGIYQRMVKIGELSANECVGEMAVISHGPRSATIIAEEDTELYRLTSQAFYDLLFERTEIALEMMKLLSRRLRSMNARIPVSEVTLAAEHEAAATVELDHDHSQNEVQESNETIVRRMLTLQRIGLFAHCSQTDFLHLAHMVKESVYEAGEPICRIGEDGDTLFGIIEGQVQVHKGSESLASLGVGQSFGEMAIIDGEPRSADCKAVTRTVLIQLSREQVIAFCFQRIEVLKGIIRVLAERFQQSRNRDIGKG
ncbi:Npt1/Npt2 family nucleotide transporter [Cohnella mopanensis]|uniref:Npt1/Npt2 family nucleotide transporter n=1 Tax=Cohnella mopanensis TaxID=2911966 RepID=UPI001EF8CD31|nr:Npt1/Npt2 family nucleotide transporter [Cohnella mopanensis]